MQAELPRVIATYVAASNDYDPDTAAACFAPDAVVRDEGHERRGTAEIAAWRDEVTRKYQPHVVVTEVREEGGRTVVTGEVSGNFPGSPVALRYAFTLADGRIARLDIGNAA